MFLGNFFKYLHGNLCKAPTITWLCHPGIKNMGLWVSLQGYRRVTTGKKNNHSVRLHWTVCSRHMSFPGGEGRRRGSPLLPSTSCVVWFHTAASLPVKPGEEHWCWQFYSEEEIVRCSNINIQVSYLFKSTWAAVRLKNPCPWTSWKVNGALIY